MRLDAESTVFLRIDMPLVNSLHDDLTHFYEGEITVLSRERWGLKVILNLILLQEFINSLFRNLSLVFQVGFVSNKAQPQLIVGMGLHFSQPVREGLKSDLGAEIENHKSSYGTSIVGTGDRPERLLSRSIPDL